MILKKFSYSLSLSLSLSAGFRLTIIFLMLFFSDFLFTQVRIKEKVVIKPQQSLQNINIIGQEGTEGVVSGFIMPKKGILQVVYEIDDRFSSGGQANYLTVNDRLMIDVRHGSTVILDTLPWRFANINVFFNVLCGQYNTKTHYYNDVFVPVTFVPVQKGDTIQFYYLTKNNPSGADTILTISDIIRTWMVDTQVVGWQFDFTSSYNNCAPFEYLQVSMYATDTTLKFTKPASDSICPNIPVYNDNLSRKNWIDLELKATFGDSLMKNVWVKVDTAAIADSGGHSHNGNRPMGKYRIPKLPPALGYDTVRTFVRKTDSTGVLKFRYLASEFGGIEKIKVKLLSDTTSYDTIRIKVKVDSLYDFATLSSNYWTLTGNTGTTTYGRCSGTLIKHYDNHWFHPKQVDSLRNAIRDFFEWAGTDSGGGQSLKLRINDMSLKFGGLFDICADWRVGHFYHRTGNSVDISKSAIRSDNNQLISLSRIQVIELERIMKRYGGKRYLEPSIHFGFGGKY